MEYISIPSLPFENLWYFSSYSPKEIKELEERKFIMRQNCTDKWATLGLLALIYLCIACVCQVATPHTRLINRLWQCHANATQVPTCLCRFLISGPEGCGSSLWTVGLRAIYSTSASVSFSKNNDRNKDMQPLLHDFFFTFQISTARMYFSFNKIQFWGEDYWQMYTVT